MPSLPNRRSLSSWLPCIALAAGAGCAQAADGKAPPLPPGSARVKIEAGQAKADQQRMQQAPQPQPAASGRTGAVRP